MQAKPGRFEEASGVTLLLDEMGIARFDPLGRKLTAHSFRHTHATKMAEAVDDNQLLLSRILGHKQITITNRYTFTPRPKEYKSKPGNS